MRLNCVIVDDELAVLLRYVDPGAEGIQIFRYDVSAYLHEILVEYIPVAGVIKMHHRLLVLNGEIEGGDYGRLEAVEGVMFVDDLFRFLHYDALDEGGKIGVVVVEGIPVDEVIELFKEEKDGSKPAENLADALESPLSLKAAPNAAAS